jgi:hypothetical protein
LHLPLLFTARSTIASGWLAVRLHGEDNQVQMATNCGPDETGRKEIWVGGAGRESDPFPLGEIQPPVILNLPWQVKNPAAAFQYDAALGILQPLKRFQNDKRWADD